MIRKTTEGTFVVCSSDEVEYEEFNTFQEAKEFEEELDRYADLYEELGDE